LSSGCGCGRFLSEKRETGFWTPQKYPKNTKTRAPTCFRGCLDPSSPQFASGKLQFSTVLDTHQAEFQPVRHEKRFVRIRHDFRPRQLTAELLVGDSAAEGRRRRPKVGTTNYIIRRGGLQLATWGVPKDASCCLRLCKLHPGQFQIRFAL